MTRSLIPADYQRTRVLGHSVTQSIWSALYAAIPNPSQWECLWASGASIDTWANPFNNCWLGNGINPDGSQSTSNGALLNPTDSNSDPTTSPNSIDRVILNVSGFAIATVSPNPTGNTHSNTTIDGISAAYVSRMTLGMAISGSGIPGGTTVVGFPSSTSVTLSQAATATASGVTLTCSPVYSPNGYPPAGPNVWLAPLNATIANIRAKYPSVRMIILEPNLAGVGFATCADSTNSDSIAHGVRCTYTSPYVQSAIASVCLGNVREGLVHAVDNCNFFSDSIGHLTSAAQTTIGNAVASYYANNL